MPPTSAETLFDIFINIVATRSSNCLGVILVRISYIWIGTLLVSELSTVGNEIGH
jgi:hypothetical protein